ncbi:MAG: class III extradiol ring-cleavage dioxygenase, partial [Pseudomonadota bacterium]
ALLSEAGIDHDTIEKRGFDHGTWVPLSLLYPQADIPVVQLSVQPHLTAAHHYAIGHALRPLVDENILVIGTGALTHNLGALFSREGLLHNREDEEVEWARQFADWMNEKVDEGDIESLLDVFEEAPFAVQNHPTPEHLLPFFVALGASTNGSGERLHKSTEFAVLAMDAFAFH